MKSYNPNRTLSILVVLLMILNLGYLVVFALKWFPNPKPLLAGGDQYLIQELKLRNDQKKVYMKLKEDLKDSLNWAKMETRKAKDTYFELLKQDHPDQKIVDSLAQLTARKEIFLDELTFRHFRQIREILDPDQKKRFGQILQIAIHSEGAPPPPPGRTGRNNPAGSPGQDQEFPQGPPPGPPGEIPPPPPGS